MPWKLCGRSRGLAEGVGGRFEGEGGADGAEKLFSVEGFGEDGEGWRGEAAGVGDLGGDDDDGELGVCGGGEALELPAVDAGHLEVGEEAVDGGVLEEVEGFFAGGEDAGVDACGVEEALQGFADAGVVVDGDQERPGGWVRRRGLANYAGHG